METQEQTKPRDTHKIAYVIHFLLGAGNLLPWNAFITAVDYFTFAYPSKHIERVFSIAYMSSSVLVLILMTSWGGWRRNLTIKTRMNIGLSLFILSLLVTPILDWTSHGRSMVQKRGNGVYMVTVASVVVCGFADGLIGGSLIGSAGELPKEFMQAIFAGTASSGMIMYLLPDYSVFIVLLRNQIKHDKDVERKQQNYKQHISEYKPITGVLVCILRVITKAALPQNPQGLTTSAHFYFIVSTILLLGCLVCNNLLFVLPVMQEHYKLLRDNLPAPRPKFWKTARRISWPACGICLTYIITLSIFPGFIADGPQSTLFKDWYPILLITVYNVSDLIGKASTAIYLPRHLSNSTWVCTGRLLFYPLYTACLHGPSWLRTEIVIVLLTSMLGITNGCLTSVLMILAPKSVPSLEAETAAVVMVVFLGLGLIGGSVISWLWIV